MCHAARHIVSNRNLSSGSGLLLSLSFRLRQGLMLLHCTATGRLVGLSADDPPKSDDSRPAALTPTMRMGRAWSFAAHYDLSLTRAILLRRSEHAESAISASPGGKPFCILLYNFSSSRVQPGFGAHHAPRARSNSSVRACGEALHLSVAAALSPPRSHQPAHLHSMPANCHTRSRYIFFSGAFSFSVREEPVEKCGSMRNRANGRRNCLGQDLVDLVQFYSDQHPGKIVSFLRRLDD